MYRKSLSVSFLISYSSLCRNQCVHNGCPYQVSISGVILLTQANISRLGLWLVQVAQRLVCIRKLNFIGLNFRHERSHCTFARSNLARQHLHRLELIDVGSTSKSDILSGIVRDCHNRSGTEKDCLALALYFNCYKYT